MENDDRALTIKEVAGFLNISNQMVYNLIKAGELPAFRIGSALRILYSDLKAYIEKQKKSFAEKTSDFENRDDSLFVVQSLNAARGGFSLQDISFSFPRGKILSVLGASGSGKTMLLRSIAGLNHMESGYIFLGEKRLDILDAQQRNTGFVFQNQILFPHLSIKGKKTKPDFPDKDPDRLIEELLCSQPHLKNSIKLIPGGLDQFAGFVRDKIFPFELLLMDEPFDQLDPESVKLVAAIVRKIASETGKTSIIAFSNAHDVLALQSDYTAVINQGKIIQFGKTGDVYNSPETAFTARLFSGLGVNTIPVGVHDRQILPWHIETSKPDGEYRMIFRTEEIRISDEGILVHTETGRFYDGLKKIITGKTDEGTGITLLVPENTETDFRFIPANPFLFEYTPDPD